MADTTVFRDTKFAGLLPARGTYPMAANTYLVKGAIVDIDASGNAVTGGDGVRSVGKASANFDNRTGSEAGGLAGNLSVEVEYGVFGFTCSDTPQCGDIMYTVDNQTVSTSSSGGTRPIAGLFSEKRSGQAYVHMGPLVSKLLASTDLGVVQVPLRSFGLATGAAIPAFNDGVADGFVVSEGTMLRFNPNSTTVMWAEAVLPADLDDTKDVEIHIMASREGSADVTAAVTVTAFFHPVGDAYDADANCGGVTGAIAGATKVTSELTVTLAAADVPAGPVGLSFSMVPTAALDADDMNIHRVWLEYSRKG